MLKCTGDTFASLSHVIGRCRALTEKLHLNENGWRQNTKGEFFWRFVVPVLVERTDVSDNALARQMLLDARRTIDERLAALEPKDGLERIAPSDRPADLRTTEGRLWKREHAGATA